MTTTDPAATDAPSPPATPATAAAPDTTEAWSRAKTRGALAYLLSRFLVVMGAGIAVAAQAVWSRWNGEEPVGGASALVQVLDSWDGHWYLDVVRDGYPHHIMDNVSYFVPDARAAFFPLYPMIVRGIDWILPGGPVSIALLLNFVLGGCVVAIVGVLARHLFDARTAEKAMIIAAVFPGSFVLSWAYSEALLLSIAGLCFLALARRSWFLAGLLAALGSAARPNGLALVAACGVAALLAIKDDRDWRSLLAPLLAPLGFVGFMAFLRWHTDEDWAWFRVQREAWKESTSFGATAVERTLDFFVRPFSSPTSVLTAATVVAMIWSLLLARRHRIPLMYHAYAVSVLVLMLAPATVTARPRFLYTAFPLIFPVARALRDDDDRWWPIVVVVLAAGLVTVNGIYGVRGAIP
ncbi:MAG: hypothetical protein FJW53_02715 [Actinobacteria bacterium]|nr:hypothetical protein [Actinomycetota bacterium]